VLAAQIAGPVLVGPRGGGDAGLGDADAAVDFVIGVGLHLHALATIGEIVTFMNFATMLFGRLEQVVGFVNYLFMQAPKWRNSSWSDTSPSVADAPGATDPGRLVGEVASIMSVSLTTSAASGGRRQFRGSSRRTIALVGSTGSGKSTTLSLLHRVFRSATRRDPNRWNRHTGHEPHRASAQYRRGVSGAMLFARSIEENLRVGNSTPPEAEIALALERAQASEFVARSGRWPENQVGSGAAPYRAASASAFRSPALC